MLEKCFIHIRVSHTLPWAALYPEKLDWTLSDPFDYDDKLRDRARDCARSSNLGVLHIL